ncbi:hypothetical protein Q4603_10675 [Zobellia galactanivorans]|uniref:hypothetical protein n=1 Tax=Zobellia galactanivorans (strain DSM 12802 / CCUG 47099 / CIP 106680 / NCIMB 13871 / Dsij) TaxID=63186 RepID=UPI001C06F484|nr:hypothetical protein [Zobellia galactanivorans]MBU3026771.1 hypothetical protein [Zobellia galactanivorans]MDO6809081.1 hypothetical protein [Zobellia galactanivorans]
MELSKILLAGLVGTSLMTAFSYMVGRLCDSDLGEPKLLNKLLDRSKRLDVEVGPDSIWGWVFHYLTGFLFAGAMALYFCLTENDPTWWLAIVLGCVLGLFGVLCWITMLRLHSSPPEMDLELFLLQLVGAHIIFGLGATLVFRFWASCYGL